MPIKLSNKKYIKVITKDGVIHNCIGVNVNAMNEGKTYNVWGSGSVVTYIVDTNVAYSEDVTNGDSVLSPTSFTPAKEGFTFVGWRTDRAASAEVLTSKVMNTEPITLYAVFKKTITLSYDGNGHDGGSVTPQNGTQYYNNGNTANPTFVLASNGFSKEGYSFVQWRSGSTAGAAFEAGASVVLSADTTFYVEWFDVEITVFSATFTENNGSMTFEEVSRSMDSSYLSSVMQKLSCGAGYEETNTKEATVLALTSKAKSEYKYVTINFRTMLFVYYGNIKATVGGQTIYNTDSVGAKFNSYSVTFPISNTNWKAVLESYNGSDYYGCDNNLAVQSIVLSVS